LRLDRNEKKGKNLPRDKTGRKILASSKKLPKFFGEKSITCRILPVRREWGTGGKEGTPGREKAGGPALLTGQTIKKKKEKSLSLDLLKKKKGKSFTSGRGDKGLEKPCILR